MPSSDGFSGMFVIVNGPANARFARLGVRELDRPSHWPPRSLPRVLHLYDTATQEVRQLQLREPGQVSVYLCGPTVYAPPHLGHGRATLVYDVLRRYLEWSGRKVRLVSNITDL